MEIPVAQPAQPVKYLLEDLGKNQPVRRRSHIPKPPKPSRWHRPDPPVLTEAEQAEQDLLREKASQRLLVLKARQVLREQSAQRAVARKEKRMRESFGHAVFWAGCGHFSADEVVGMLLDAKERMGESEEARLAMRRKGVLRRDELDRNGRVAGTAR